MSGFFPKGPIGFQVHGIGFRDGHAWVHATVAIKNLNKPYYQELNFFRVNDRWEAGIYPLDDEENQMLVKIWEEEFKKKGVQCEAGG